MVNFSQALEIGLNEARQAEKNKAEIKEVFKDLNSQLEHSTKGKLSIKVCIFYERIDDVAAFSSFFKRKKYTAIGAKNPKASDNSHTQLALWNQDSSGYPCTIQFGKNKVQCHDREALEDALTELLRDPAVGEILFKLINLPDSETEEDKK